MRRVVVIGGGTGTSTLLQGLKKYPLELSVIVSTADDGGSTGRLRTELGVIPPGDIRQCLVALSSVPDRVKQMFNFRFTEGPLKGHAAGNIILASLEKSTGSIEQAVSIISKELKVSGHIYPVTLTPTKLTAVLENGKKIVGEHNIDEGKRDFRFKIADLRLKPNGPANPKAINAIKNADIIIFGPGDLYTSTLPNLLVKGINEAVNKSKAKKVFITNIMTKHGQTDGFSASDFVAELEKYLHGKISIVLANNKKPAAGYVAAYKKENSDFIGLGKMGDAKIKIISDDFLSKAIFKKASGDNLKRSMLRHDSAKLAKLIYKLVIHSSWP
jgi:uncharacterized cofD-like protein